MKYIFYILFGLAFYSSTAQNSNDINFMVTVNEELMISLSNFRIDVNSTNKSNSFLLRYVPGKLKLTAEEYNAIFLSQHSELEVSFTAGFYDKEEYYQYDYKIPFKKKWLVEEFCVLSLYNLNKKKYRKKFKPLHEDGRYSFSINLPSSSIFNLKQ